MASDDDDVVAATHFECCSMLVMLGETSVDVMTPTPPTSLLEARRRCAKPDADLGGIVCCCVDIIRSGGDTMGKHHHQGHCRPFACEIGRVSRQPANFAETQDAPH